MNSAMEFYSHVWGHIIWDDVLGLVLLLGNLFVFPNRLNDFNSRSRTEIPGVSPPSPLQLPVQLSWDSPVAESRSWHYWVLRRAQSVRGSTQLYHRSSMITSPACTDAFLSNTSRRWLTFLGVVYTTWEDIFDRACLSIFNSCRRGSSLSDWSFTPWCKTHEAHVYISHLTAAGRCRSKTLIHHCNSDSPLLISTNFPIFIMDLMCFGSWHPIERADGVPSDVTWMHIFRIKACLSVVYAIVVYPLMAYVLLHTMLL